jgi:hypothetical protein
MKAGDRGCELPGQPPLRLLMKRQRVLQLKVSPSLANRCHECSAPISESDGAAGGDARNRLSFCAQGKGDAKLTTRQVEIQMKRLGAACNVRPDESVPSVRVVFNWSPPSTAHVYRFGTEGASRWPTIHLRMQISKANAKCAISGFNSSRMT